jgi:hypothetical protein
MKLRPKKKAMKTQQEKFEALKSANQELYLNTLSEVTKSKSAYLLTNMATGETRRMYSQWGENDFNEVDNANCSTIAAAICFPELGIKVECLGSLKFEGGVVKVS